MLNFIGLITLFSINSHFFISQLIFTIISLFILFFISQVDYKTLASLSTPIYVASLIALLVVLLLGIASRGAVRWLEFFGLRIQFSEILKPLLTISLASFLSTRKSSSLSTFLLSFALLIPIWFLIYRQPDLGNALIYMGALLITLLIFGFPFYWFGIGIAGIGIILPLFWKFLHQYQRERLLGFFHFTSDPLGISYNAIQSIIAVGSGLFFGKGLGQGTQSSLRFLPERHTDFIFATLSEELGFIGGLIVVLSFCLFFYRLYIAFQNKEDSFCRIFITCTFAFFLIQFFVNIGMNIGLLPIVGVTLPFVSYGGSSLISNAIFLGIVFSMLRENKTLHVLEIG